MHRNKRAGDPRHSEEKGGHRILDVEDDDGGGSNTGDQE
jgi:hypothetical protein